MGLRVVGDKLRVWGDNSSNKLGLPAGTGDNVLKFVDRNLSDFGMTTNVIIKEYEYYTTFRDGNKLWMCGRCHLTGNADGIVDGIVLVASNVVNFISIHDNPKFKNIGNTRFYYTSGTNWYGWGDNFNGEVGVGSSSSKIITPTRVNISGITNVILYYDVTYFITNAVSDNVYACGKSINYSFGKPSGNYNTPQKIIHPYQITSLIGIENPLNIYETIATMMINNADYPVVVGTDRGGTIASGTCSGPSDIRIIQTPQILQNISGKSITQVNGVVSIENSMDQGYYVTGENTISVSGSFRKNGYLYNTSNEKPFELDNFAVINDSTGAVKVFNGGSYRSFTLTNIRKVDKYCIAINGNKVALYNNEFSSDKKFSTGLTTDGTILLNPQNVGLYMATDYEPIHWCTVDNKLYVLDYPARRFNEIATIEHVIQNTGDTTPMYAFKLPNGNVITIDHDSYGYHVVQLGVFKNATNQMGYNKKNTVIGWDSININNIYYYGKPIHVEQGYSISNKLDNKLWLPFNTAQTTTKLPMQSTNGETDIYKFRYNVAPSASGQTPIAIEIVDSDRIMSVTNPSATGNQLSQATLDYLQSAEYKNVQIITYDDNGFTVRNYILTLETSINFSNTGNLDLGEIAEQFSVSFNASINTNPTGEISYIAKLNGNQIGNGKITSGGKITVLITSEMLRGLVGFEHNITIDCQYNSVRKSLVYVFTTPVVAPTISGTDTNLGYIATAPVIQYSVQDISGGVLSATVKLDGVNISTIKPTVGVMYTYTPDWANISNGQHTVLIVASNGYASSTRTYTFYKTDRDIIFSNYTQELGIKREGFSCNYTVNSTMQKPLSGEILLNGERIELIDVVPQNKANTITISDSLFQTLNKANHTITVKCSDGSISRQVDMHFTRGNNPPSVVEGSGNLGDIYELPPFNLSVVDPDRADNLTLTVSINTITAKTYTGLKSGDVVNVDIQTEFSKLPFGNHQIETSVTDGTVSGETTIRFNKIAPLFKVEIDRTQIKSILHEIKDIKYRVIGDTSEKFSMNLQVNGVTKHTVTDIMNNTTYNYSCPQSIIDTIAGGNIELTMHFVSAVSGKTVDVKFNTRKVAKTAEFVGKNTIVSSRANRIFFNSIYKISPGATISVFATNNAGDQNPVWENATAAFINGDYHKFTNTTKTTSDYIINIKIIMDIGTSVEYSYISKLMYSVD